MKLGMVFINSVTGRAAHFCLVIQQQQFSFDRGWTCERTSARFQVLDQQRVLAAKRSGARFTWKIYPAPRLTR